VGELFYREQRGPEDAEVKPPEVGVDYSAVGPTTFSTYPTEDSTAPPGNNSPEHRDDDNPSSAKVIPDQMRETLRDQLTYIQASRVAARWSQTRTAATIGDLLSNTGPEVHKRSLNVTPKLKRADPRRGIWTFEVTGSTGKLYKVWVKGKKKGNVRNLDKAQIQCTCTCPFWRWQGPEHWGKKNKFLYQRPRGTASDPVIRDPREQHWACKHVLAALEMARKYRLASEQGWSFEGELVPMANPARVALRYAAHSPAESAAISLLQDAPDEDIEHLIRQVERSRTLFDPVSRESVDPKEVADALRRLQPKSYKVPGGLKVYHATSPQVAKLLLSRGFIPKTKPKFRGDSFGPGRGIDQGLYVGATPRAVSSYDRVILEVTIPKNVLVAPTESTQLGDTDPLEALRQHNGALIPVPVPPEAFKVVEGSRYLRAG
jgi:hypothetical protein